jgi:hypothetical protein
MMKRLISIEISENDIDTLQTIISASRNTYYSDKAQTILDTIKKAFSAPVVRSGEETR